MGTKDSFSGGGGNLGNDRRDGIDDWLDPLPGGGGGGGVTQPDSERSEQSQPVQHGPAVPGGVGSGSKPKLSPSARRVLQLLDVHLEHLDVQSGRGHLPTSLAKKIQAKT